MTEHSAEKASFDEAYLQFFHTFLTKIGFNRKDGRNDRLQKQRVLSFLLAGVLAFSLLGVSGAAADDDADEYKEELDALSSRYDELEAQQKSWRTGRF